MFSTDLSKDFSQLIVSIIIFSQDFAWWRSAGVTPLCLYRDKLTLNLLLLHGKLNVKCDLEFLKFPHQIGDSGKNN